MEAFQLQSHGRCFALDQIHAQIERNQRTPGAAAVAEGEMDLVRLNRNARMTDVLGEQALLEARFDEILFKVAVDLFRGQTRSPRLCRVIHAAYQIAELA